MLDQQKAKPCDKRLYDFYRVPGGSTFEIWVEGEAGAFDSVLTISTGTDTERVTLPHDKLYRAPGTTTKAQVPLGPSTRYLITLWTSFLEKTTVTLEARIVKPAGSTGPDLHGSTPIRCSVTAAKGTEDDRAFFIVTSQQ